jgi:hypothetical protein
MQLRREATRCVNRASPKTCPDLAARRSAERAPACRLLTCLVTETSVNTSPASYEQNDRVVLSTLDINVQPYIFRS